MNNKISVIVPVYNAELTLERCIDSVLAQTHRDLELILVDDGSRDSSALICDRYAQTDSRVMTIHVPNAGPANARNMGIESSNGAFIAFLDSDDVLLPNALAEMLAHMQSTGADLVQACTAKVYKDGKIIPESDREEALLLNRVEAMSDYIRNPKPIVRFAVWGKLFRRGLIGEIRFCDRLNSEDVEFVAKIIDASRLIAYYPATVYHTFVYDNSLSRRKFDKKRIDDTFAVSDTIISVLQSNEEYISIVPVAYRARILTIMSVIRAVYDSDLSDKKSLLRWLKSEMRHYHQYFSFDDIPHKVLYYACCYCVPVYCALYRVASKFF